MQLKVDYRALRSLCTHREYGHGHVDYKATSVTTHPQGTLRIVDTVIITFRVYIAKVVKKNDFQERSLLGKPGNGENNELATNIV